MSNKNGNALHLPQNLQDAVKDADRVVESQLSAQLSMAKSTAKMHSDAYEALEADYKELRKKHSHKITELLDEHAEELKAVTHGALFVGGVVGSALTIMVGVGFKALVR
jgi:hypothetical protein